MNVFRLLIRPCLYMQYAFSKVTKTGSFGVHQAVYTSPVAPNGANPLKKALFSHYVRQFSESSCSVASVAIVVNAILDIQGNPSVPPLTQANLLDDVATANWKKRMSPEGDNGKRGLPLFMLGDVVKSSLERYKIAYRSIETIQVSQDPSNATALKQDLISRLKTFDPGGKTVIIAHFNQGMFVKALQIPHISPVAGFDSKANTVTILDVDYLQENPYTISFETFYNGLSSDYNTLFRSFGYGSGGYVCIHL